MYNGKLKLIILFSVLLRVAAALYLGNEVTSLPGTADQVSYHELALRVLDGHGFTFGESWWPATAANEPTGHWSYLYTIYLVLVYAIFGPHPVIARLLQAVIVGVLQPYLAYRLASQLLAARGPHEGGDGGGGDSRLWSFLSTVRNNVPLIAAAITAIYIYFVYYAATLMTEPFYFVTILASLSLAISIVTKVERSDALAIMLGLALASTVLLRQLFLLIVPVLFLWMVVGKHYRQRWMQSIRPIAVSIGVLILFILPITVFNYTRFERFVLLNTNAGYAFFWANHPVYGNEFIPAAQMEQPYQDLIPADLQGLDEAALDQALLGRGLQFVADDPVRYVRLSISRIPEYIKFWPEADSSTISNVSRVMSFGVFLPLMIVGLLDAFANLARRAGRSVIAAVAAPATLLILFIFTYTIIHILSWTQVRYRLPVDAVLVVFAAMGMIIATRVMRFMQPVSVEREGTDLASIE